MKEQENLETTERDPNWIKDVENRFLDAGEKVGNAQPTAQASAEPTEEKKKLSIYPPAGSFNFIPGMGCMGQG